MTALIMLGPGEGTLYTVRGGTIAFKALGADTDAAFSLMDRVVPAGARMTPAHAHPGAEGFFVLEGKLEFHVGGEIRTAGPATFVLVRKGERHTFGNTSDRDARLLIIHSPAADAYFAELHDLWSASSPPSAEVERELQRRHGWETG